MLFFAYSVSQVFAYRQNIPQNPVCIFPQQMTQSMQPVAIVPQQQNVFVPQQQQFVTPVNNGGAANRKKIVHFCDRNAISADGNVFRDENCNFFDTKIGALT